MMSMTPERWHQVKELLHQAQELAAGERSAFLERSCASDHLLRQEVETLLSSSDEARTGFLESCPISVTLNPGTKLGEYEVQRLIGSGGMGEVYRARDLRLRRDVAIKVLPSFLSSDKDRLRRFEQEAQAAAALNHPNILAVFQMGSYQNAPYLVSELLEGDTLRAQIGRGALSPRKAIESGVQIAHGLAAAHEKGIVHRDLKPENLFVTKDGHVKILDFGLAKLTQPMTRSEQTAPTLGDTEPGMVMGTAGYMSPEQVRGQAVDHRTDIFAFGAILYEMLTGKRAFVRTTSADTMSAILNAEPLPISQLTPNVPSSLQRAVHRCLEKSPERRFQSASDLAFALETLSDSALTPLPQIGITRPATPPWRILGVSAAAAALLIAGGMWWLRAMGVPRLEGARQLTDDGEPKLGVGGVPLVTDGLRIYFQEGSALYPKIVQVSVNGGQTSPVPMRFQYADLNDLAPDASALLISPTDDPSKWIQPLPGGEARNLGFGSESARFLPDGRIALSEGSGVYVMNADGSRRKLADAPGQALNPVASPDGKRIRFTVVGDNLHYSIWETNADGTDLHQVPIAGLPETIGEAAGNWTRDGKYFLFQTEHRGRWDLWALPENARFSGHASPLQLTNGPLSYESAVATRDGKQIFAVGSKKRGELVRYDAKSREFVPWLSGISAVESRVSPDGKWIIYVSYPDRTLWRSRSDGSERVQLTFPPLMVFYPEISPDGTKVAFSGITPSSGLGAYVLKMEGGTPEKVVDLGHAPTWSPDGNSLAFGTIVPGRHLFDESHWCEIHVVDLRTKQVSVVPTVEDRFGPWWPRPDKLVAASTLPSNEPYLFDFKTQKWSKIGRGFQVDNWVPSGDGKYLYLLTSGKEGPKVRRIRASDFTVEVVADIGGLRLVSDDTLGQASSGGWIGLAPDASPTLTHDVGSDEIYGLDVKWP
jgi:eukaryotic-like serine/threonine-protein kinase